MKLVDLLSLSTRVFATRPMRTFLTIFGVSIGIGAVLFLVSLGYGIQRIILNQITTADALLSLDVTTGASGLVTLDSDAIDRITNLPAVSEVSRLKNISAQISLGELTTDVLVNAIDPSFLRLNGIKTHHGQLFESATDRNLLLSSAAVGLFGLDHDAMLGQKMNLVIFMPKDGEEGSEEVEVIEQAEPFTVAGVIQDDTLSYAYLPLSSLNTTGINTFDQLKIKVINESEAEPVREQIIGQGFVVSSLSDVIDQANQIFSIVKVVLALFGLIALSVSAIGMFNTMTITLLERINEIGIMRSLGITRWDIRKLFLIEAMLMGFLGGLGGVVLGYGAGELANGGINLLAKTLGGEALDLFYQPTWFVLVIIIFSTIIGFLTGIFPSRRAAKMDPLEALRYK